MYEQDSQLNKLYPFWYFINNCRCCNVYSLITLFNDGGKYNSADIAWIIVATALVFLMTPGLAFFYGGMVHRKNVLSTMIKSLIATGVVSVVWVVVGYSLCFGDDIGGFIGNPASHLFFKNVAIRRALESCSHYSSYTFCFFPVNVCSNNTRTCSRGCS